MAIAVGNSPLFPLAFVVGGAVSRRTLSTSQTQKGPEWLRTTPQLTRACYMDGHIVEQAPSVRAPGSNQMSECALGRLKGGGHNQAMFGSWRNYNVYKLYPCLFAQIIAALRPKPSQQATRASSISSASPL